MPREAADFMMREPSSGPGPRARKGCSHFCGHMAERQAGSVTTLRPEDGREAFSLVGSGQPGEVNAAKRYVPTRPSPNARLPCFCPSTTARSRVVARPADSERAGTGSVARPMRWRASAAEEKPHICDPVCPAPL